MRFSLPMFPEMTEAQARYVAAQVLDFPALMSERQGVQPLAA